MLPIDPSVGEFRVHYAGFFDPGFGTEEARSQAAPRGCWRSAATRRRFCWRTARRWRRLVFEPMTARPSRLYGENGSHYQGQGLKLSKHFRVW